MLSGVRYNYLMNEKLGSLSSHLSEILQSSGVSRGTQESALHLKKYVDELKNTSNLIDRRRLEKLHSIIKNIQENKELAENFNQAIRQVEKIIKMYQIQSSYLQRIEKLYNHLLKELIVQQDFTGQLVRLVENLNYYEKEKDDDLILFLKKEPGARIFSKIATNREVIEMIGKEKEAVAAAAGQVALFLKVFKNENTFLPDIMIELREQLEKILNQSSDDVLNYALDHVIMSVDNILSKLDQFNWEENVDIGYYHFLKTGLGKYIEQWNDLEKLTKAMNQELESKKVDYAKAPRKATLFDKNASRIRDQLQLIKSELSSEELLRLELFDVRGKSDFDKLMMMMSDKDFNRFLISFKPTHHTEKAVVKNEKKPDKTQQKKTSTAKVEDKDTFVRAKKGW